MSFFVLFRSLWGYCICRESFTFAVKLFLLPWAHSFCREVISIYRRRGYSFSREVFLFAVKLFLFAVRLFFLPWVFYFYREVISFAVTVVDNRKSIILSCLFILPFFWIIDPRSGQISESGSGISFSRLPLQHVLEVNKDAAGKFRILSISVIGFWGRTNPGQYSRGCSGTVSFIFEQSGAPLPPRGLIILFTRRPELSAILNWTSFECNGFRSPF